MPEKETLDRAREDARENNHGRGLSQSRRAELERAKTLLSKRIKDEKKSAA